ncbi:NUDIX hydrolase [Ruegeria sp. EL01]|jgi:8-oxo-dGTP pyrophosphatase MutT (NUDIX family)|uniref:NUDIX hydrolase n=1 Tax=Ruegeria sp. EL01 TaxID=2107578 RepID=UPI000EA7F1D2|nr:NUDIX hydrolase [Ruegeria sp. EL01]
MNARLLPNALHGNRKYPVLPQSAALCYRIERGRTEVLLITTRRSRRWIIPKGWLISGLTTAETAAQEAWEEAGVRGKCNPDKLGQFTYLKQRPDQGMAMCVVDVFPIYVRSLASSYPEKAERSRKWCSPKKAASKVQSSDLAEVLRSFKRFLH